MMVSRDDVTGWALGLYADKAYLFVLLSIDAEPVSDKRMCRERAE